MKFTASTKKLLSTLQKVAPALSDNNVVPACSMFLFVISDSKLTASATDLQTCITNSIDVDSDGDFKFLVTGRDILDYLGKFPECQITFTLNEQSVIITAQQSRGVLPIEPGDDFPKIVQPVGDAITIPQFEFTELLRKTAFAVSEDDLRPSFQGVYFEIEPTLIRCTATNAHKLSTHSTTIENGIKSAFIVPGSAIKKLPQPVGNITLHSDNTSLSFSYDGLFISCRLIGEKFPDYKAVIPINNPIVFATSRAALLSALKRVINFSVADAENYRLVKLDISDTQLTLTGSNIDFAKEATEVVPGSLDGEPIQIGVTGSYLLQILSSIQEDDIFLHFSQPNRAIIITENAAQSGNENIYLLMPSMIKNG